VPEDPTLDSQSQNNTELITFDYIKSNLFRVVTADGAHASVTPQGKIFLSLYNERNPIPRQLTYEFLPDNTLGRQVDSVERDGYVREVEFGIVMDIDVARSIASVLSQSIKFLEELEK
jgi:hypothetical protein